MTAETTTNAGHITLERATAFGSSWNSHDADLVVSFFAPDGEFHSSVGPEHLGMSWYGRDKVREGVEAFWARYPDGQFENLVVRVEGDRGTFEWDFVWTGPDGAQNRVAGCDLLEFRGDLCTKKNAFRKTRPA